MDKYDLLIESIAVLLGDYSIERKYAAVLLLKILLPKNIRKDLLNDPALYPYDRNDSRVAKWRKQILKRGSCEVCGAKKRLEAHHIIKWADYPAGRIDLNNGQCLCHKCHTWEHRFDPSYALMKSKL